MLRWTERAAADLMAIGEHIAADDPTAARAWVEKLRQRAANASKMRRTGRVVPEIARDDVREVFQRTYRIVYRGSHRPRPPRREPWVASRRAPLRAVPAGPGAPALRASRGAPRAARRWPRGSRHRRAHGVRRAPPSGQARPRPRLNTRVRGQRGDLLLSRSIHPSRRTRGECPARGWSEARRASQHSPLVHRR
jgi:toxin ParE1/3/4